MAEKKTDPTKTWNDIIEALIEVRELWEEHKAIMSTRPNIEKLPIEAQKQFRFIAHNATTFEKFLDAFMLRWQQSGGLETLLIDFKAIEKRHKAEAKAEAEKLAANEVKAKLAAEKKAKEEAAMLPPKPKSKPVPKPVSKK